MKVEFRINKAIVEEPLVEVQFEKFDDGINDLLSHINKFSLDRSIITIKSEDTYHIIEKADIIYLEVTVDLIKLVTTKDTFTGRGRLYKFMEELSERHFIQVSKSAVINAKYLLRLETSFAGNMVAVFKNSAKVSISRNYLSNVKNYLNI